MTPEDAHELLTGVWERLGVGAHASLVGMLRSFREGSLPMHALCARSEQLLAGQPDLLAAFQEFVPRVGWVMGWVAVVPGSKRGDEGGEPVAGAFWRTA